MGLPSVRLSWSWTPLADEQQETKPRDNRRGNLSTSLAPFVGRLRPQGRSAQVRGLLTSPTPLLWGAAAGRDTPVAHMKAAGCVPLLTGASKCPHMQTCMYAHTPHTLIRGKHKADEIVVVVCFRFCLFCQHYGLCPASVLSMVFSGELLE